MEIKILGPGCYKCHELDKKVREVAKELGVDAQIEYVQDIRKIMEYPILTTPGLVVDGNIVCSGRVPSKSEIKEFITKAL
jgi:small redox-active disulfide protein 2